MQRTPEREKQFALTKDYLSAPWVIIMRTDSPYYSGLHALSGKTIAVERGFVIEGLIKKKYPEIQLESVDSAKDALVAVATAQADAYVANLAVASYLIRSNRLHNLGVMAPTPFGVNTQAMAIRPDWQVLAGIIDKALAAMTLEEKAQIDQRWARVEFKEAIDYELVTQITIAAAIIFLLIFIWNRRLAREVVFRKAQQGKIEHLAYYDPLTELPNRLLGREKIKRALVSANQSNKHIAVIFIDINKFKLINDMHGNEAGDRLLKEFANRLRSNVATTDTVCRMTSDTFMILLVNAQNTKYVTDACIKIRESTSLLFAFEELHLRVDISIGVALSEGLSLDAETIMRNAETALQQAKLKGLSCPLFFAQQMNDERIAFGKTRESLRQSIELEEFELYYQPKIDLRSKTLKGAEALIRWRPSKDAIIGPSEFISVAEESGLIIPIGKWVLRRACEQTVRWQASGFDGITIALNVSAVQLMDGGFKDDVIYSLRESGLDAKYLELEITESLLLQDFSVLTKSIDFWRDAGIRVSIDDFGTGYSNLSYLQQFRGINTLKIDRSFTSQISSNKASKKIVQAMVNVAHALDLSVVAEGVEDALTLKELEVMGCDEAQGYYFSKPLPANEFEAWSRKNYLHDVDATDPGSTG